MPSQNVPHLCGGILFDLLLETRKERAKIRDRANGGTDSLSDTDVYVGLANIVTGENLSSSNGETLNKYVSNYKNAKTVKDYMCPLQMKNSSPLSIPDTRKKALPSSKGQQGS